MLTAYKPVQYTFSLGRQPAVRRWLEPASCYAGIGIGFGVNYAFTDHVGLSRGYRYVSVGERTIDLTGGVPGPYDELDLDLQIHEFRVAVRIRVFEFFGPWR